tara:strand:- start:769 stop:1182 length:414 start_codon:yes stop_codon:yes gene_type:complete
MISYKHIDILQLSINNENKLLHKDKILEIKSPIILFSIKEEEEDYLYLSINKESNSHNIFLNLSGYIERLYNIKNIDTNLFTKDIIKVYIGNDINYQVFDTDYKNITKEKLKYGGKAIMSFVVSNGKYELVQLLILN